MAAVIGDGNLLRPETIATNFLKEGNFTFSD